MKTVLCLLTGLLCVSLSAAASTATSSPITVTFEGDAFPGKFNATLNYGEKSLTTNLQSNMTYTIDTSIPDEPLVINVGAMENSQVVCALNGDVTYTLKQGQQYMLTGQAIGGPIGYACTVRLLAK